MWGVSVSLLLILVRLSVSVRNVGGAICRLSGIYRWFSCNSFVSLPDYYVVKMSLILSTPWHCFTDTLPFLPSQVPA